MLTTEKYKEKVLYLIDQLSLLKDELEIRDNFYRHNSGDFKETGDFEKLFSQIITVKKKLADLQNDMQAELEYMTM